MRVPAGTQVGKYTIEREIDRDPLGTLYQARAGRDLFRVRILNSKLTENDAKLDILFESAEHLVRTQHPIMTDVREVGEGEEAAAGLFYIVTEWADTNDKLAQISRRHGVLSPADAANFILYMADAFVRLHKSGVVHGGLTPENIAISIGGRETEWIPKITEFVIHAIYHEVLDERMLPFLSPEVLENKRPGPRADIYSLGVLFLWLMTGTPILDEGSQELLEKLPTDGVRVIQQALHTKVNSRFQDMERFYAALTQVNWPEELLISVNPYEDTGEIDQDAKRIIIIKDDRGQLIEEVPFNKNRMTIGRSSYDMIQLEGDGVDQEHIEISFTRGRCFVNALSERSKTYLNGLPMTPKLNQLWDIEHELMLGRYVINWAYEAARIQTPYFDAIPEARLSVSLAPTDTIRVKPGGTAFCDLMIRNEVAHIVSLNVQVHDLPAEWVGYDRNRFKIGPLQAINFPIGFNPPKTDRVSEGNHPFRIQVNVLEGGEGSFGSNGRLDVSPYTNTYVEFSPTPWENGEAGFAIIHNKGNGTVNYHVEGVGKTAEMDFDISESEISIPPGRTKEIEVVPRLKRRPWFGDRRLAVFDLLLQTQRGGEQISRGQLMVKPYLTTPKIPPMGLLAIGMILLILFAVFARQPVCDGRWWNFNLTPRQRAMLFCADTETLVAEELGLVPPPAVEPDPDAGTSPTAVPVDQSQTDQPIPTSPPAEVAPAEATPFTTWPSASGTTISAYRFGSGPVGVILVGGVHSGRGGSSAALAEQLIDYYQQPENSGQIPANVSLYVVDDLNPDGSDRFNPNGTELNRNGSCGFVAGQSPDGYQSGSGPYSEPENQGLRSLYDQVGQIGAVIFYDYAPGFPASASPGVCPGQDGVPSDQLAQLYAEQAGIVKEQAGNQAGDLSNSALELGAESIFVLLADANGADINNHLGAVESTMARFN